MNEQPCTILVVEDNRLGRQLIRSILDREFFTVIDAADANEAWQALVNDPPDLVITDIVLPGGENGLDLLRKIRSSPLHANIPVIGISCLEDPVMLDELHQADFNAFLSKPLNLEQLVATIRSLLPECRKESAT